MILENKEINFYDTLVIEPSELKIVDEPEMAKEDQEPNGHVE